MHIAILQLDLHWENCSANLAQIEKQFKQAIQQPVDIVVLPEMFTTGFSMNAEALAEPADNSPTMAWMQHWAARLDAAIVGSLIIAEGGKYYNRLVFMQPNGVRFFYDKKLAALVSPRKAFRPKIKSVDTRLLAENLRGEFDALESLIETIEPAHFKVPVLFRQYLRQNAKFIAFNVDPNFSNCLDGLMILDIAELPASTIEVLQQEK